MVHRFSVIENTNDVTVKSLIKYTDSSYNLTTRTMTTTTTKKKTVEKLAQDVNRRFSKKET